MNRRTINTLLIGSLWITGFSSIQCTVEGDDPSAVDPGSDQSDQGARGGAEYEEPTTGSGWSAGGGGSSGKTDSGAGGSSASMSGASGSTSSREGKGGAGSSGSSGARTQTAGSGDSDGGTGGIAGATVEQGGAAGRPTRGAGGRGGMGGAGGRSAGRGAGGRAGSGGSGGAAASGGYAGTAGLNEAGGGAGSAGAGGGPSADGCGDTLAGNLTLQQLAVYQSVKIPVMEDGAEISPTSRKTKIVQGRETMFRVFVTPGNGWTPRELSARLTLVGDAGKQAQYYSKKSISKASTDADLATTFQITVPATGITAPLRYHLEVVECGTQSTAGQARFPATGDIDLGVKTTGGLKIKIIPLRANDLVPDTSQTVLDAYAKEMMAMYPIDAISITVGDTLTTNSPINWSTMADQVRAKRESDAPESDVYYFGLVKPAQSMASYCRSSCTLGIGLVVPSANQARGRAAVGVGFGDAYSYLTMAHEIGHNHGRNHAPCVPSGGTIAGVDSSYPYSNGALGTWGWDSRTQTLSNPTKSTDIMGYCNNQWISDYTYNAIMTRVTEVNGAAMMYTPTAAIGKWRVLLVEDRPEPRWGIPIEKDTAAEGSPEPATIYDHTGGVLTTVTVYRTLFSDIDASMVMVPEPASDWYAVEVAGAMPHPFAAPVTVPRP